VRADDVEGVIRAVIGDGLGVELLTLHLLDQLQLAILLDGLGVAVDGRKDRGHLLIDGNQASPHLGARLHAGDPH
jgi:hypothetical protein